MKLNKTNGTLTTEEIIRDLEEKRVAALAAADFDVLEELFEPAGIYCHSSGRVDMLADYVRALRGGFSTYLGPAYDIQSIVATSSAAHVWGVFSTAVIRGTETLELDVWAGVTWMLINNQWKVVAVQTTRRQPRT